MEKSISEEAKDVFKKETLEILIPIEISAMKSVVVRHFDKMIVDYEDGEIIESINRLNDWAGAEEIYNLQQMGDF